MLRSDFLKETAAAIATAATTPVEEQADYTIRIGRADVELAPGRVVNTTTYNGGFPGPLVRLHAGRPVVVDLVNETATPEQLHWHGQRVPADVDGAAEERTSYIPAHGQRRIRFTPGPAGLRFYHTHLRAGGDLAMGQYSGQAGPVYIEPAHDFGRYDREVFLVLKEFEPSLMHGGDMAQTFLEPNTPLQELKARGEAAMQRSLHAGMAKGYEVGYRVFSINGRMLGHGEPIQVRRGDRVLFHILNASATEIRSLALPQHEFLVVGLDGNPVSTPARVPVLWIGTAERVDAIVRMDSPGVWILGDTDDGDRSNGMGIVLEYAGSEGPPQWATPPASGWDYTRFGSGRAAEQPDESFTMLFEKRNAAGHGFNIWTINGKPYAGGAALAMSGQMDNLKPAFHLRQGKRYRLRMRNASDDIHPIHLHRHTFELTRVAGRPTSGVLKDVVMLGGYQEMEIDFVADNPGLTLFHCHQQLHMDFGFMALFDYV